MASYHGALSRPRWHERRRTCLDLASAHNKRLDTHRRATLLFRQSSSSWSKDIIRADPPSMNRFTRFVKLQTLLPDTVQGSTRSSDPLGVVRMQYSATSVDLADAATRTAWDYLKEDMIVDIRTRTRATSFSRQAVKSSEPSCVAIIVKIQEPPVILNVAIA